MSRFPSGPWTDPGVEVLVSQQLYSNAHEGDDNGIPFFITNPPTYGMLSGGIRARTGFNSGVDHSTPRPYTLNKSTASYSPWMANDTFRTPTGKKLVDGWNKGGWPVDRSFPTLGFASFQAELLSKVNMQTNKDIAFSKFVKNSAAALKGLATVGEGRETLRMLEGALAAARGIHNMSVKDMLRYLRRSNRSFPRFLKNVADINLTWSFGIVPVIMDINATLEALTPKGARLAGSYSGSSKFNAVLGRHPSVLTGGRWPLHISLQGDVEVVHKVGARFSVSDDSHRLPWRLGFSSSEILPALWELLPYSWLVDYFSNVSEFVQLSSLRRADITHGYGLDLTKTKAVSVCTPQNNNPYPASYKLLASQKRAGTSNYNTVTFNRYPLDVTSYVPSFRFEVPSLRQAANVASVAAGLLLPSPSVPSYFKSSDNWARIRRSVRR